MAHEFGVCGGHTITGATEGTKAKQQRQLLRGGTELNTLLLSCFDGRPEEGGGTLYWKDRFTWCLLCG